MGSALESAGGDTFNDVFLHQEVNDQYGDRSDSQPCHKHGVIGYVGSLEHHKAPLNGHFGLVLKDDQSEKELIPDGQGVENNESCYSGPRERKSDAPVYPESRSTVNKSGFRSQNRP